MQREIEHSSPPAPDEYAEFEGPYIARVPRGDLVETLRAQRAQTLALLRPVPEERAAGAPAPGKWTMKEVLGHVSDTERIMAYRALRIARGDATPLPGFEQDPYVREAGFGDRAWADLLEEYDAVRGATIALFAGLPPGAWGRRGIANQVEHTVRALGYVIAGHELHHRAILERDYLAGA